ncbi:MAG: chemotaxis protein CheX [bacterium]
MSTIILDQYSQYFKQAINEVANELLEKELEEFENPQEIVPSEKKLVVIIGMTGDYKGRVLLEITQRSAEIITEIMNYGPLEEENYLYFYMGEFVNIVSGRAITYLNNMNKDRIVRLTPPAIFSGNDLKINTPNVNSTVKFFHDEVIQCKLDIGFEGV